MGVLAVVGQIVLVSYYKLFYQNSLRTCSTAKIDAQIMALLSNGGLEKFGVLCSSEK